MSFVNCAVALSNLNSFVVSLRNKTGSMRLLGSVFVCESNFLLVSVSIHVCEPHTAFTVHGHNSACMVCQCSHEERKCDNRSVSECVLSLLLTLPFSSLTEVSGVRSHAIICEVGTDY